MRPSDVVRVFMALAVLASAASGQALGPLGPGEGAWTPPPCTGVFTDVPCGSQFAGWVEQYYRDGITSGCATGLYCPESPVTRRQMAVFVERAMRGTSTWPPNTVIVPAVLGADGAVDAAASGQALLDAVASIPTSGATMPGSLNPWHVILGPGVFDVASTLVLPAYLTLEGTGKLTTTIRSSSTTSVPALRLAQSVTLRHVMVSKTAGASGSSVAVECVTVAAQIEESYIDASGGVSTNSAIFNDGCSLVLSKTTVYASGGGTATGVVNDKGTVWLRDSEVFGTMGSTASYAVRNLRASGSCSLTAIGSTLWASTATVASDTGTTVKIGGSYLNGGALTGPATCAGVWDESFTFSATTCP